MHSNTSLVVLTVTKHLYSFNCSMYSVIQQNLSNSSIRYFFVGPGRIPIFVCMSVRLICHLLIRHLFLPLRSVLFG